MKPPPSPIGTIWESTARWLCSFSGVEVGWLTDGTEGRGPHPWIFFFCPNPIVLIELIKSIHPVVGEDTYKYSTIEVDVCGDCLRYKLSFINLPTFEKWRRDLKIEN